ncbi:MAG: HD-GYP domain-containing protein [Burkholderiaceae bacterium]|nr:HD-GYP domain-containing protein [Burkholderiaceae bacterium]
MLKKIAVADLRLGMHLHRFEGAWIDHPFWRVRFIIADEAELRAAQSSAVRECWIDTDLGLDLAPPDTPATSPAAAAIETASVQAPPPPRNQPTTLADELRRAAELCKRSRAAVKSMFAEVRLGHALDAQQCLPLVQEISDAVFRNPEALVSLARLKTADDYSYMHSVAVCALMVALGRTLGLDHAACREAGLAGLLHDMGKALMPIEILNKPGKLSDEEFAVMRSHPERGWALLREGQSVGEPVLDVCLHHHEKIDGSGYPHGLAGERITLLARMGAVCDVYDAVTSNRPYKAGWDPAQSMARMARWQGHFDPAVFAAFVKSVGIYPTGSLVRLASGKLAVVVGQNPQATTLPSVKAFFSTESNLPLPVQTIDLAHSRERIAGREPREAWNFPQIESLWAGEALET